MGGFATYDKGGGVPGTTVYADNFDFTGVTRTNTVTTNGQLPIGSTAPNAGGNNINIGQIVSPGGTITVGYSSPNITIDIAGGSAAIERVTLQTGSSPITPTGGTIIFNGAVVAAGTNPVRTDGTGLHTMTLEVQKSQALASADATKIGLSNFNSAQFTVDANGFVSTSGTGIGNTITGDSGGALSPTAGNWNILGRSGSKTSGSGSTLTIKSPPFSQVGSSSTSVLNSGEFVTAAVTRTLPATAGVTDGDLVIYYCTTAGALVVTGNTGQTIRIGSAVSSSAGTATSNAIGDSLTLRFDATAVSWRATAVVGNWTLA